MQYKKNVFIKSIITDYSLCMFIWRRQSFLMPAILLYMVADNNLDYYAVSNIKQTKRELSENITFLTAPSLLTKNKKM